MASAVLLAPVGAWAGRRWARGHRAHPAAPLSGARPAHPGSRRPVRLRALAESDDAAKIKGDDYEDTYEDDGETTETVDMEESLSLTVSSPALLLNHMAERYTSTSRILMEFVDNGFDDGEALFQRDEIGTDVLMSAEHSSFVSGSYTRPLEIDVVVNKELREVRVVDNSRGMPRDVLQRVVLRVGESRKRGMAFLNGQFGFGMQAFRAACEGLRVRSRHETSPDILEISVNRSESGGFRVLSIPDGECPALPSTGTEVTLSGFDEQWLENGFDPEDIAAEIECHFERLLSRQGLRVRVLTEDGRREVVNTHVCRPFDYADPALGVFATVQRQFVWPEPPPAGGEGEGAAKGKGGKGGRKKAPARETRPQAFDVCLSVVGRPMDDRYRARIFVNGRRIKEVNGLSSFSAATDHRWDLWGHAQVVGYIDVAGGEGAGALQPVITRDEFKRTRSRKKCYERIVEVCEPDLLAALEGVQQAQSDSSMGQLESVITACLAGVSREEYPAAPRRPRKAKPAAAEPPRGAIEAAVEATGVGAILRRLTGQPEPAPEPAPGTVASEASMAAFEEAEALQKEGGGREQKGGTTRVSASSALDFEVRMVRGLPDGGEGERKGGPRPRSMLVGNTIMVDTEHPDFKARLKTTRGGRERFDERLCGYLSTIVSAHYRDRAYLQRGEVPESREQVYEDMINTYVRLEERLRRNLPALMAQMAKAGDGGARDAGSDPSLALLRRRARDR